MKVVLEIQAGKKIAIVFEFPCALLKLIQRACFEGGHARKAKCTVTKEARIVHVHAAAFDDAAESQVVLPAHPTDVVAPGEIVSHEQRPRVVSNREIRQSGNADVLNRLSQGGLKNIYAQVRYTWHIGGGAPVGSFSCETESEIVD